MRPFLGKNCPYPDFVPLIGQRWPKKQKFKNPSNDFVDTLDIL